MVEVLAEAGSDTKHYKRLKKLLRDATGTTRIATAYLTERQLISRRLKHEVRLLVPDSIPDIARGAISLKALEDLIAAGVNGRFSAPSPKLHAKVYIFGDDTAIVSSANFTHAAMHNNIEAGVEFSGPEVQKLIAWYDQLWARGQDITANRLQELRLKTADIRRRYAELDKKLRALEPPTMPDLPPIQDARGVEALFATAERFFVCNTDRKDGEPSPSGGYLREEMMAVRGFAAAWETFKFPTHMNSVRAGDAILAFAKGVGIIGVGRATGPCTQLPPGDRQRLFSGDSTEWRVPVEWLDWRDEENSCTWEQSYNFTFWDVSEGKYAQARENVRRHFVAPVS